MAKTMARIKDGVVINLEWVDDDVVESDVLRNTNDLRIRIGDVYRDSDYYRDDIKVISHRSQLRKNIKDYDAALTEIAMLVNATMTIAEGATPSIEERKQAILFAIANMNHALETIKEGGLE